MARPKTKTVVQVPPAAEAAPVEAKQDPIARAEAATRIDLDEARRLLAKLEEELSAGADVTGEILMTKAEIAQHEAKLRQLAELSAGQAARNTKAAREARHQVRQQTLKEAQRDARRLGERVKAAQLTVVTLGAELAAIEEARASIYGRVSDAISDTVADERTLASQHTQLREALSKITMPDHFLRRIYSAGLGRTGIKVDESFLHVSPLNGVYAEAGRRDVDDVISEAVEKLRDLSNAVLRAAA